MQLSGISSSLLYTAPLLHQTRTEFRRNLRQPSLLSFALTPSYIVFVLWEQVSQLLVDQRITILEGLDDVPAIPVLVGCDEG